MATALASRRLFSEFRALTTDPPDGIIAGPVTEDDIFTWEALIQGPEGTPFEGGVFVAELKFPKVTLFRALSLLSEACWVRYWLDYEGNRRDSVKGIRS